MIHKIKYFILAYTTTIACAEDINREWVNLLENDSLKLWKNGSKNNREKFPNVGEQWTVKDGVLFLDKSKKGRGGHIITSKDDYFNFELKFEFKISAAGNSGVKYRVDPQTIGLEFQILDNTSLKVTKNSSSSLYQLKAANPHSKLRKPNTKWNKAKIIANGNHLEHWLNGEKVVSIEIGSNEWKSAFAISKYKENTTFAKAPGPIFLQDHGSDVFYRNIFIKETSKIKSIKAANNKPKAKSANALPPHSFTVNCAACHLSDRIQVGPHFVYIQNNYPKNKRQEFIEWCLNPGKNNPDMPQMPSMAHIPKKELSKIHDYILSIQVKRLKNLSNKDPFPDTRRPRIIRTFLPDCGPASLFVALPTKNKLNLVWDTTQCRLRYLTIGEPDNFPYLKSNGNSLASPGKPVYIELGLFHSKENPIFNGYKVKNGLPSFLYEIDGIKLEETISVTDQMLMRVISSQSTLPNHRLEQSRNSQMKTEITNTDNQIIVTHTF